MNTPSAYDAILLERFIGDPLTQLCSSPTRPELEKLLRLLDITRALHRFWPFASALARALEPNFFYQNIFRSIPDFATGATGLGDCLEHSFAAYCTRVVDSRLLSLFAYDNLRTRYIFGRSGKTYVRKISEHRDASGALMVVCEFPIRLLRFVPTLEWLLNCHAPDMIVRTLPYLETRSAVSVTRLADKVSATEVAETTP